MTPLRSRTARAVLAVVVGVVAAVVVPLGNLWLKCQQPVSEACVWTRAYLPLSLAFTTVILGVPVFVVTLVLLRKYAATLSR